jgi:hypothetical protein
MSSAGYKITRFVFLKQKAEHSKFKKREQVPISGNGEIQAIYTASAYTMYS